MTIDRRGLKVKVKVMDQVNAMRPTSIEDSFSSMICKSLLSRIAGTQYTVSQKLTRPEICNKVCIKYPTTPY